MIVTDGLLAAAARSPQKIAISCDGRAITYAELESRVRATEIHVGGARRIAVALKNNPDLLIVFLAAVRAGALTMVLDPSWPENVRRQIVAAHKPDIVISATEDMRPLGLKRTPPMPSDLFLMGFTSGTTGTPKAFVRTHASWVATFAAARAEFGDLAAGTVLAPGPLSHSLTLYAAVETLEAGGTLHLQSHFDPATCVARLAAGEATTFVGVPSMLDLMCAAASVPVTKSFAVICAGAKLSPTTQATFKRTFPAARLFEYYGASELSFMTIAHPNERPPSDSVGRAFRGVTIAVRRDDGTPAAPDMVGTVWVKSAMVSDGYVGATDGSGFRTDDGWATVGDQGSLDAHGFLTLVGRENEMLITGGFNVYPQEIESVIGAVQDVTAAAVFGVADARWGQIVVAVIEGKVTRAALIAACEVELPGYKRPRRWFKIATMPRTASGKIARAQVRDTMSGLQELP